jgi:TonB family protein
MTSKTLTRVGSDRRVRNGKALGVGCLILLCMMCARSPRALAQAAESTSKSRRKVLVTVQPKYPAVLREGRFEGQVRLAATVLANGKVSKVETQGGNPMFSQFAEAAVKNWKYAPGPAQTVEEVVFNFNPDNK